MGYILPSHTNIAREAEIHSEPQATSSTTRQTSHSYSPYIATPIPLYLLVHAGLLYLQHPFPPHNHNPYGRV